MLSAVLRDAQIHSLVTISTTLMSQSFQQFWVKMAPYQLKRAISSEHILSRVACKDQTRCWIWCLHRGCKNNSFEWVLHFNLQRQQFYWWFLHRSIWMWQFVWWFLTIGLQLHQFLLWFLRIELHNYNFLEVSSPSTVPRKVSSPEYIFLSVISVSATTQTGFRMISGCEVASISVFTMSSALRAPKSSVFTMISALATADMTACTNISAHHAAVVYIYIYYIQIKHKIS